MTAYVVGQVVGVKDPDRFNDYRQRVGAVIEQYGGKVLAAGQVEALEGGWQPTMVVIAFDSLERAREWYGCEEYRPLRELRQQAADVDLVVIDGV